MDRLPLHSCPASPSLPLHVGRIAQSRSSACTRATAVGAIGMDNRTVYAGAGQRSDWQGNPSVANGLRCAEVIDSQCQFFWLLGEMSWPAGLAVHQARKVPSAARARLASWAVSLGRPAL